MATVSFHTPRWGSREGGGSGARIMTTMVLGMRDNGIRYGLQTMCEGGGQANATILELL